ncbi:MAG: sigma-70 family RNA polymerase sigma factor [Gaiellaceae bacterium]
MRLPVSEIESLYRERYRHFLRVATAIVDDEATGHDAVQEAFSRVLKKRASFRDECPLEAWVWRVVVNTARGQRRAQAARREWPESAGGGASLNGRAESDTGIRVWIATLPERQRLAIFLRYFADLDYQAIATALDVEVGTVSATLSSAHRALRRSLEEVER